MQTRPISLRRAVYWTLNTRFLPFRYLLIFLSVKLGSDHLRTFNVSLLKGMRRTELYNYATGFVDEYLASRPIPETQELLREKAKGGLRIVLCSASIEPVVDAISDSIGVRDRLSSTLLYEEDVFTGKIALDITGSKLDALRERDLLGHLVFAASDNVSDLDLLKEADDAKAIVHEGRKREFWEGCGLEVLDLKI